MATTVTSGQKKVWKKLHRKQVLFSKAEPKSGVKFITDSSPYVFIGNGGLQNGLSRDLLTALLDLSQDNKTFRVHLYPGKDYSFCTFESTENAVASVATLNGVCVQEVCKKPNLEHLLSPVVSSGPPLHLYLSFVDRVPSDIVPSDIVPTATPSGPCEAAVPNRMPPGLLLLPEFISHEEEGQFIEFFAILSDDRMKKQNNEEVTSEDAAAVPQDVLKHRSVRHYGYEFLYGLNNVDPDQPLPGGLPHICMAVLKRMLENGLLANLPDQLTVNQYLPGAGIPPHVDTHSAFEDGIISITLGSHTVMDFRHPDGTKVSVFLQRRSLLIMKGDSRYIWTHGITARKSDIVNSQMPGYGSHVKEPLQTNTVTSKQQDCHFIQQSSDLLDQASLGACELTSDQATTVIPRGTRISLTFRKIKREPCTCGEFYYDV